MNTITKEVIKEHFNNNDVVKVTFNKKDGTKRVLIATNRNDMIPENHKPIGNPRKKSDDVFSAYDLENEDWRSFRFDSVIEIEIPTSTKETSNES